MSQNLTHLLAFFKHRSSLSRYDLMEPMRPVFEEGMNVLEDIDFVWCYRTRDNKVDTAVLTDLGVQKVKELIR